MYFSLTRVDSEPSSSPKDHLIVSSRHTVTDSWLKTCSSSSHTDSYCYFIISQETDDFWKYSQKSFKENFSASVSVNNHLIRQKFKTIIELFHETSESFSHIQQTIILILKLNFKSHLSSLWLSFMTLQPLTETEGLFCLFRVKASNRLLVLNSLFWTWSLLPDPNTSLPKPVPVFTPWHTSRQKPSWEQLTHISDLPKQFRII